MRGRGGDEFADQFVARRPAVKRDGRIMSHLGRKLRGIARGDVGEVGDDQVERALDRVEQMALPKMDAIRKAKSLCVFAGERESVGGKVDGMQFGVWKTGGEGERDHAAAGPDIEHARDFRPWQVA